MNSSTSESVHAVGMNRTESAGASRITITQSVSACCACRTVEARSETRTPSEAPSRAARNATTATPTAAVGV